MASNDILDTELRRQVSRERFGKTILRDDIKPTSQELSRSLPRILADFDLESGLSNSELNRMLAAIRKEFKGEWRGMWDDISGELVKMSIIEGEAVTETYNDFAPETLAAPTNKGIVTRAATEPLTLTTNTAVEGTWSQFVSRNISTTTAQVVGTVRDGYKNGLTASEITRQLRGAFNRRTGKYVGGVLNGKAVQGAESLALTGISHYANMARDEFAEVNDDLIQGRILFATLDNRTTKICLGRHLNEYPTGEPFPPLPFHFRERSQYIFKTEGFDPLNTQRPAVGGQEGEAAEDKFTTRQDRTDRKVRHRGRKDTDIFDVQQIEAKTTADAWLKRQPRWFVESNLGKERAKLFLDGKLPLDRFTDMVGNELTLDELRATTAGEKAFRRAET